jgi:hypothetical protein
MSVWFDGKRTNIAVHVEDDRVSEQWQIKRKRFWRLPWRCLNQPDRGSRSAITGDTLYYTQTETASFFNKRLVTWDMVTKIEFRDGRITNIKMFLDLVPIEEGCLTSG